MFDKWLKANGVVKSRHATQRGSHGIEIRWAYVVEVRPPNEPPFQADVKDPLFNGSFVPPEEGDDVMLEYKPGGDVRFDTSDPRRKT